MSFNYAELATTATQLITEFGASATLRVVTDGTYDPATGVATTTTTDTACTAVEVALDQKMVDGALIRKSDSRVLISVSGVTTAPVSGNQFIWGSTTYSIIIVKPIAPARVNVVYDVYLRAA